MSFLRNKKSEKLLSLKSKKLSKNSTEKQLKLCLFKKKSICYPIILFL